MIESRRSTIQRLMSAMAAGDTAAIFPFIEAFGDRLAASVKFILRDIGRSDAGRSPEDLDFLVQSAALVIFDRSSAWDQDRGAAPWVWAHRAIRAVVIDEVGLVSGVLPDSNLESFAETHPIPIGGTEIDWAELGQRNGMVRALLGALNQVATNRDTAVHLEYLTQRSLGDPSPANTVASMFGLSPANVRQIDRRVRIKLGRLAVDNSSYAILRSLAWVGA